MTEAFPYTVYPTVRCQSGSGRFQEDKRQGECEARKHSTEGAAVESHLSFLISFLFQTFKTSSLYKIKLRRRANATHAMETARLTRRKLAFLCGLASIIFYCFENFEWIESVIPFPSSVRSSTIDEGGIVPKEILGEVYSSADFINDRGIRPPFWDCTSNKCNTTSEWGPCYAGHEAVTWSKEMNFYKTNPPAYERASYMSQSTDLAGLCRPGFIIIGAGKCGTR